MADISLDTDLIILIAKIIAILIISVVLMRIFNRWVSKIDKSRSKLSRGLFVQIKRFFQLTVYSIVVLLILWTLNIDVIAIVAGLGIGALIIGFGLKEIIENWVSGLILITERTYRIGDVIEVGDLRGVVTDISLRTTSLKTYNRNDIVMPNSSLLNTSIINLTSGEKEIVSSVIVYIDYVFAVETAKKAIESVLRTHPNVIVDEKRKREIRFVIRAKEWTTEIETLFWINQPENQIFINSEITELIKKKFEEENILPPIPGVLRREFLSSK